MAMIAITTKSSVRVNPSFADGMVDFMDLGFVKNNSIPPDINGQMGWCAVVLWICDTIFSCSRGRLVRVFFQ
jgi:hypothetical protein